LSYHALQVARCALPTTSWPRRLLRPAPHYAQQGSYITQLDTSHACAPSSDELFTRRTSNQRAAGEAGISAAGCIGETSFVFATGAGTHDVGYFGRRDFFSARRYVIWDASCERRICRLGYGVLIFQVWWSFTLLLRETDRLGLLNGLAWALTQLSSHTTRPTKGLPGTTTARAEP
jgi:hypothetical protein